MGLWYSVHGVIYHVDEYPDDKWTWKKWMWINDKKDKCPLNHVERRLVSCHWFDCCTKVVIRLFLIWNESPWEDDLIRTRMGGNGSNIIAINEFNTYWLLRNGQLASNMHNKCIQTYDRCYWRKGKLSIIMTLFMTCGWNQQCSEDICCH